MLRVLLSGLIVSMPNRVLGFLWLPPRPRLSRIEDVSMPNRVLGFLWPEDAHKYWQLFDEFVSMPNRVLGFLWLGSLSGGSVISGFNA